MDVAANSVPFGNVQLARLRPSHFEAWVKTMTDKPLQPGLEDPALVSSLVDDFVFGQP
jgi:hypothetical protein